MSQHDDIHHHVKIYMRVFGALMFLTVVTVAVSYMHLSAVAAAIAVALAIAVVKGSLVAGYFMHLVAEKKIIYAALILTAAFFLVLMLLPTLAYHGALGDHHLGAFEHVAESVPPAVH